MAPGIRGRGGNQFRAGLNDVSSGFSSAPTEKPADAPRVVKEAYQPAEPGQSADSILAKFRDGWRSKLAAPPAPPPVTSRVETAAEANSKLPADASVHGQAEPKEVPQQLSARSPTPCKGQFDWESTSSASSTKKAAKKKKEKKAKSESDVKDKVEKESKGKRNSDARSPVESRVKRRASPSVVREKRSRSRSAKRKKLSNSSPHRKAKASRSRSASRKKAAISRSTSRKKVKRSRSTSRKKAARSRSAAKKKASRSLSGVRKKSKSSPPRKAKASRSRSAVQKKACRSRSGHRKKNRSPPSRKPKASRSRSAPKKPPRKGQRSASPATTKEESEKHAKSLLSVLSASATSPVQPSVTQKKSSRSRSKKAKKTSNSSPHRKAKVSRSRSATRKKEQRSRSAAKKKASRSRSTARRRSNSPPPRKAKPSRSRSVQKKAERKSDAADKEETVRKLAKEQKQREAAEGAEEEKARAKRKADEDAKAAKRAAEEAAKLVEKETREAAKRLEDAAAKRAEEDAKKKAKKKKTDAVEGKEQKLEDKRTEKEKQEGRDADTKTKAKCKARKAQLEEVNAPIADTTAAIADGTAASNVISQSVVVAQHADNAPTIASAQEQEKTAAVVDSKGDEQRNGSCIDAAATKSSVAREDNTNESFHEGQEMLYLSAKFNTWVPCKVVKVDAAKNAIQVNVKPGYWFKAAERKKKMRLPGEVVSMDAGIAEESQANIKATQKANSTNAELAGAVEPGGDASKNQVDPEWLASLVQGSKVKYWSQTVKTWISATVVSRNPDGTFDLDLKRRAQVQFIRPAGNTKVETVSNLGDGSSTVAADIKPDGQTHRDSLAKGGDAAEEK